MLLPFEFAVLTVPEAKQLLAFIETQTATKSKLKNYEKIQKLEMLDLYEKLRVFVEQSDHYHHELRDFNSCDYAKSDFQY